MVKRRIGGAVLVLAASLASLAGVACTASTAATDSGNGTGGNPDSSVSPDDSVGPTQGQDASDPNADAGSSCQTGGLATDTYVAGLQKVGKPASGDSTDAGFAALTFTLEGNEIGDAASPPAEPYTNAFTLKLTDPSGAPVTDATVLLPISDQALGWPFSKDPWMPLHGHGASIQPTITNNMDGTYTLSVYFFMPGLWQIYIVAETEAGAPQSAMYSFCLP